MYYIVNSFKNKIRSFQRGILDTIVKYNCHKALEKRSENFVKLFENWLPKESRVLDIGGGWGFYFDPLKKRGHHATVLDVVKPGYQKSPVVLYEGKKIPFDDESFDVSLMITMLHHVPNPRELIKEVRRVTKKYVVVVEDLYNHPLGRMWTEWRDKSYNIEFLDHPCQFKKKEEWKTIFSESGFSLVDCREVYTWLLGFRILNGIFIFKKD